MTVPLRQALSNKTEYTLWKEAIQSEFNSLVSKETGVLVPRPADQKIIGGMWRLTKKLNEFGEVD